MKERDTRALLLGILFASAALRMYSVTTPAIIDEPFSLYVAKLDPSLIISSCASDVHPPLYYLILHYWILVFQDSELAMRLPSVVFSVLAVYVVYRIGGRLFSREVGLLSALIAGISAFQIAEAQSARMYSLLVLLTLVSMYAFIRLRDETTWDRSLEYIAVTVALLYTHVYGIFIVVAQNLFVLSIALIMKRRAPHLGAWLALQLVVALLFAPWLAVLLTQRANTEAYSWIGAPTISRLLSNFSGYTGGSLSLALVFALCSLGAVLTWKTARGAFKWKTPLQSLLQYRWVIGIAADYKVYLLILWLLIPNLLPFIYSYISAPIYYAARFTIPASMALYVLTAKGIASVRQIAFKLGVVAVIVALSMTSIAHYYAQPRDDIPYKAIAAYVDENAQPGDLMLFINRPTADHISRIDQGFDAYSKRTDLHKVTFPATFYDMSREEQLQTLNATVQHQSRIWVLYVDGWDYLFNESALGSAGMDCQNLTDCKLCH